MIHRDLKPANVMLTEEGEVVLTDFGVARIVGGTQLTVTGALTGTPDYMSPEQCRGERGDERSDVYSLGVMLYEMLTGQVPFGADTPWAVIQKHISAPLPPPRQVNPSLSEALQLVVLKALEKEPSDRFAAVADLAHALESAYRGGADLPVDRTTEISGIEGSQEGKLDDSPTKTTVPPRPRAKAGQGAQWKPLAFGLAGLVVVALIVLGLIATGLLSRWMAKPAVDVTVTSTRQVRPAETSIATATRKPESTPSPTPGLLRPVIDPRKVIHLYRIEGRSILALAEDWERPRDGVDVSKAEIVTDPKGYFGRVVRLSVRGYGDGTRVAWVNVMLPVPAQADIVSVPVATGLNGAVNETDSESAIELAVREPQSGRTVWTYASHMFETELDVPYIYAFADVSAFRGRKVELSLRLRQADVCAGAQCTHDADAYIGDLVFERLPDVCTTGVNGRWRLYDYSEDPTPREVDSCLDPQPYYYVDVREGPHNDYGPGRDRHTLSFDLPQGAMLLHFRLYYGRFAEELVVNGHVLGPEQVYAAFPVRLGTYVNIPEPSRYMPVNRNPVAMASYFRAGTNTISMVVSAREAWEERPFDLYARFRVPSASANR
jgi:hypothetical protein